MGCDLSVIVCHFGSVNALETQIKAYIDVLNEHEISHEFIVVIKKGHTETDALNTLTTAYHSVTCVIGEFTNGLQGMTLCGCMLAKGRYVATLDPRYKFKPRSLITLWHALKKSNCQLMYGRAKPIHSHYPIELFKSFKRWLFSFFSGRSSQLCQYRLMNADLVKGVKAKTPFFFLLEQVLLPIGAHSYLVFEVERNKDRSKSFKDWISSALIRPFAWTYLAETVLLILTLLNLYLLIDGKLMFALALGILAFLSVFALYLIKLRRRIAYKITKRIPSSKTKWTKT